MFVRLVYNDISNCIIGAERRTDGGTFCNHGCAIAQNQVRGRVKGRVSVKNKVNKGAVDLQMDSQTDIYHNQID